MSRTKIKCVRWSGGTIRKAVNVPGRNEICPCGSGKKFKRCCGDNDNMIKKNKNLYKATPVYIANCGKVISDKETK